MKKPDLTALLARWRRKPLDPEPAPSPPAAQPVEPPAAPPADESPPNMPPSLKAVLDRLAADGHDISVHTYAPGDDVPAPHRHIVDAARAKAQPADPPKLGHGSPIPDINNPPPDLLRAIEKCREQGANPFVLMQNPNPNSTEWKLKWDLTDGSGMFCETFEAGLDLAFEIGNELAAEGAGTPCAVLITAGHVPTEEGMRLRQIARERTEAEGYAIPEITGRDET